MFCLWYLNLIVELDDFLDDVARLVFNFHVDPCLVLANNANAQRLNAAQKINQDHG